MAQIAILQALQSSVGVSAAKCIAIPHYVPNRQMLCVHLVMCSGEEKIKVFLTLYMCVRSAHHGPQAPALTAIHMSF